MSESNRSLASKPAIVLVHGAWHGPWCWRDHFVGGFEDAGFKCQATTLPGHDRPGHTGRLWFSVDAYVEHLRDVIAEIDGPVVLIGHSMGGLVVQRLLESVTVAGAVLVASVPSGGVFRATLRTFQRDPTGLIRTLATANLWPVVRDEKRVREAFFTFDSTAEAVTATARRVQNESFIAYMSMIFRRPKPKRVQTPIFVVSGELDGIFSLDEQQSLVSAYGAKHLILKGSGHNVMLDNCWQDALAACVDWIEELPA